MSSLGLDAYSEILEIASLIALQTEIANISGGSPTAFDLNTVASLLGLSGKSSTLKIGGASPIVGIL